MFYALNENRERISAGECLKGTAPICPLCESPVTPKRGSIKAWHFAHDKDSDCDTWSEGETEWHLQWKNKVAKEHQEVTVKPHRADIKLPNSLVVELQNSAISIEEVNERQAFYKNMIWIINATQIVSHFNIWDKDTYHTFRWRWYKKSFSEAKNVNIDLGPENGVLSINKIYPNGRGWGMLYDHETFCLIHRIFDWNKRL